MILQDNFYTLCQIFSSNSQIQKRLWSEIEVNYSTSNRYYHTLKHLDYIYTSLQNIKIDTITEFAIFYHDIIYDVRKKDNEKRSAYLAKQRLNELNVPKEIQEEVSKLIIKTQTHQGKNQRDNLFLDADLAILASPIEVYQNYIENIRKEYFIYNDEVYKSGRKEVLGFFLQKERLYNSDYFHKRYENKARKNLESELKSLS